MAVPVRIGTRKSQLAKTQSTYILGLLQAQGVTCELVEIDSSGDKDRTKPLYEMEQTGTPGFFTKELEQALLRREIDLAVHSLKDLPTLQPEGLVVLAIPKREVTEDCLLSKPDPASVSLPLGLKQGAKVGTSSLRREAQLLSVRPDLQIIPIRGNVPTRVRQVEEGKIDAVVLAQAGLNRLALRPAGLTALILGADTFVPAPGQGALAVEGRVDTPPEVRAALARFHDANAELETRVERIILRELEGGCSLPLGVRCWSGKPMKLKAFLGLLKSEKGAKIHDWQGFRSFDISDDSAETLVAQAVAYFKEEVSNV